MARIEKLQALCDNLAALESGDDWSSTCLTAKRKPRLPMVGRAVGKTADVTDPGSQLGRRQTVEGLERPSSIEARVPFTSV